MRIVVAAALGREDGLWLMHRRPDHKEHGGLWEFPGGKVETGETALSALIREVREELGVSVAPADIAPAGFAESASAKETGTVILLYTIAKWAGTPTALEEGAELGWFSRNQVRALKRPPLDVELCDRLFGDGSAG